jgi:hypothetical protein
MIHGGVAGRNGRVAIAAKHSTFGPAGIFTEALFAAPPAVE